LVKGLLLVGGNGPCRADAAEAIAGAACCVAADSGLDLALEMGLEPHLVVGDMDSLSRPSMLDEWPEERVLRFPVDKDETDTEIGLRVLHERGYDEVTVLGGGGGRLDHLLGVLMLFERDPPPSLWLTDHEEIRLIAGECAFQAPAGQTVSLFPWGGPASGMSSEGLQWPLDGLSFRPGYAGISNRVTAPPVRIRVHRGRLLMVRLFDRAASLGKPTA
jgi:thiamine pyrophosphokinase